jgi:hypothetical protein
LSVAKKSTQTLTYSSRVFLYTVGTRQGREVLGGIEWVSVAETDPDEFPAPDLLDIRTA